MDVASMGKVDSVEHVYIHHISHYMGGRQQSWGSG